MSSHPKSQRQLQVNEKIKRGIADLFANSGLSTISGAHVTILEADISPNMKNCRVFLNIFGADANKKGILEKLNAASPKIRFELSRSLSMRSTPEIAFLLDESSQNAINIDSLLNQESKNFNDD